MQQKQLILLKTTRHPEVGHLYEHAYISQVRRFFATRHLHAHLDYHIEGGTYGKGVVYLTISLYTAEAVSHASDITSLVIDFTDHRELSRHMQQITLENGHYMQTPDKSLLENELQRLNTSSWENIDTLGILNLQDTRPESSILVESSKKYKRTDLVVSIVARDKKSLVEHPELLVLFHQLSWLLMHNFIASLCSQTSLYSAYDEFTDNGDSARLENTFYSDGTSLNLDEYITKLEEKTTQILKPEVLERFTEQLRTNSYERGDFSRPNDTLIYQETGIFIGQAGWNQLATTKNIALILDHMYISINQEGQSTRLKASPEKSTPQAH